MIKSPGGCTKRHERVEYWLGLCSGVKGMGSKRLDLFAELDIDWTTITMEDRIIMSLINTAHSSGAYAAYVALANSRYGMLKGGDMVDGGDGDVHEVMFGDIDESKIGVNVKD